MEIAKIAKKYGEIATGVAVLVTVGNLVIGVPWMLYQGSQTRRSTVEVIERSFYSSLVTGLMRGPAVGALWLYAVPKLARDHWKSTNAQGPCGVQDNAHHIARAFIPPKTCWILSV